jgi:hypothetical protein
MLEASIHSFHENLRLSDPDVVYIGRGNASKGLSASIWANPFKVADNSPAARQAALLAFRGYIAKNWPLLRRVHELRGKKLVCWCSPLPCHGHILAALASAVSLHGTECPRCAAVGKKVLLEATPFFRRDPREIGGYAKCPACTFYKFGGVGFCDIENPEVKLDLMPAKIEPPAPRIKAVPEPEKQAKKKSEDEFSLSV